MENVVDESTTKTALSTIISNTTTLRFTSAAPSPTAMAEVRTTVMANTSVQVITTVMANITTEYFTSTPDISILSQTQYRVYDGLLASGLLLCSLIGFVGNCLALAYFIRSRKRNLPTLLYITACCVDMVTCVIEWPIIVSLLNRRKPALLGEELFCGVWFVIGGLAQLMSMFVVMILSVTRTIVIVFPFYKIRKTTVFTAISVAFLYSCFTHLINIYNGAFYYSRAFTYCEYHSEPNLIFNLYNTSYSVWTGIMPLTVFFATLVAIFKLRTQSQLANTQNSRQSATRTIIYFAVVFLVCNCLTFLNNTLLAYSQISEKGYMFFYKNTFLFFYSWQISDIFCTVLNASLNPVLYIFRFKEIREWITSAYR